MLGWKLSLLSGLAALLSPRAFSFSDLLVCQLEAAPVKVRFSLTDGANNVRRVLSRRVSFFRCLIRFCYANVLHFFQHHADDFRPATIPIKDIVRDFCEAHNFSYGHQQQSVQYPLPSPYAAGYPSTSMWPMSLTRKLSSGSQSSQDQPTNGSKHGAQASGGARPGQQPPLTNGQAGATDSGPTTPQSSRWRHRKVTAPAAVGSGTNTPSQQRVVHVVDTHPPPDLLVNHVDQQSMHMQQHVYDYSSHEMVSSETGGRPSALKSAIAGSTAKSGRNVVIATPSIMEQMAAKTTTITLSGDDLQETVINGGNGGNHETTVIMDANQQQDSGLLMRTNSTGTAGMSATRGQQKNVIELSAAMVSC